MKTISSFVMRLIMCLMLGLIVGIFVETVKKDPIKALTSATEMVSSLEAIIPNNDVFIQHFSKEYTANDYHIAQMNTSRMLNVRFRSLKGVRVTNPQSNNDFELREGHLDSS